MKTLNCGKEQNITDFDDKSTPFFCKDGPWMQSDDFISEWNLRELL